MSERGLVPGVGETFGGYAIESLLGRGGMGAVYLATHARLARKVALKVIAPELAHDEGFRARFLRESQLAASLDHPNLIPIYDAGEVDGILFLAMRYVSGPSLQTLLRARGTISAEEALRLAEQIGGALDAAHATGLVHRDVKPANILLAEKRRPDLPLRLRPREGGELPRDDADRLVLRNRRLLRARADRSACRGRPGGSLLARGRALPLPCRATAVPARDRFRGARGPSPRPAACALDGTTGATRRARRRARNGDGEVPGRPLRERARACRCVRRGHRPCRRRRRSDEGRADARRAHTGRGCDRRLAPSVAAPTPARRPHRRRRRRAPGGRRHRRRDIRGARLVAAGDGFRGHAEAAHVRRPDRERALAVCRRPEAGRRCAERGLRVPDPATNGGAADRQRRRQPAEHPRPAPRSARADARRTRC